MKWLKWPFRFNISIGFSVGEYDSFGHTKPDARYALDTALMYEQDKVPSASVAVENAEQYLAYIEKHK